MILSHPFFACPHHTSQFVATRIKPVLRKAREGELVDMVKETGVYLRGLWIRLNGGGSRINEPALSPDLPRPTGTSKDVDLVSRALWPLLLLVASPLLSPVVVGVCARSGSPRIIVLRTRRASRAVLRLSPSQGALRPSGVSPAPSLLAHWQRGGPEGYPAWPTRRCLWPTRRDVCRR